jgi:hypothetical protein
MSNLGLAGMLEQCVGIAGGYASAMRTHGLRICQSNANALPTTPPPTPVDSSSSARGGRTAVCLLRLNSCGFVNHG